MKTLIGLMISIFFLSCAQEQHNPIEGAWKIVNWKHMSGDSLVWKYPGDYNGSELVIFSKNHFVWIGRYKKDTSFVDNFGGGTYQLAGNRLEEDILYSVEQSWVGTRIRLLWEVKNDTAFQTWPLDEKWQLKKDDYSIQKWVRVE